LVHPIDVDIDSSSCFLLVGLGEKLLEDQSIVWERGSGLLSGRSVLLPEFSAPTLIADLVEAVIRGDAVEPGGDFASALEALFGFEGPNEDFLGGLFGFVGISEDGESSPVHDGSVTLEELCDLTSFHGGAP
jgi:hypothetical protein|tara:strand:- start:338 stop:733 length:396 start_codon:yes stop_codon:yes gene_type:complete